MREIRKHNMNIIELSEVKLKKSGYCYFVEYYFFSIGSGRGVFGEAIILDHQIARREVNKKRLHGDRLKLAIETKPNNLMILMNF